MISALALAVSAPTMTLAVANRPLRILKSAATGGSVVSSMAIRCGLMEAEFGSAIINAREIMEPKCTFGTYYGNASGRAIDRTGQPSFLRKASIARDVTSISMVALFGFSCETAIASVTSGFPRAEQDLDSSSRTLVLGGSAGQRRACWRTLARFPFGFAVEIYVGEKGMLTAIASSACARSSSALIWWRSKGSITQRNSARSSSIWHSSTQVIF